MAESRDDDMGFTSKPLLNYGNVIYSPGNESSNLLLTGYKQFISKRTLEPISKLIQ
jgi:hypothetical protein